ncbi:hypothetical protein VaNZ11_011685 [Volvox africanus]|uniref:Guanylate cyclase domain-containing protein n=1 Tax=Volvox africanus TaxID=51714 RepID=A0ABQ5SC49_9CHLO|nr:hypothetical protein VaNZ11_011685 [Volvox africanus]
MLWIRRCFGQHAEEVHGTRNGDRASAYKCASDYSCHGRLDSAIFDHAAFLRRTIQSPSGVHATPSAAPGSGQNIPTTSQPVGLSDRRLAVACSVQAQLGPTSRRPRGLVVDGGRGSDPQLSLQVTWVAFNATQADEVQSSPRASLAIQGLDVESYQRLLEDLTMRDEQIRIALQQVARASYNGAYCAIKHRPQFGPSRDVLQGVATVELSTCCLALDGGRKVAGLLLVVHGSATASSRLLAESPSRSRSPSGANITPVGSGRGLGTSKVAPLDSAAFPASVTGASQQPREQGFAIVRTPSWVPLARSCLRLPSLTARMRLAAAARAVAAEVLPASVMVFTYSRGNMLSEVAYLNSLARDYLCLNMPGPEQHHVLASQLATLGLQALPARALLAAILQFAEPYMLRRLHQAAASKQGFCATLKVPAFIDAVGLVLAHPPAATGPSGDVENSGNVGTCSEDDEEDDEEENKEEGEEEEEDANVSFCLQTPLQTISDMSESLDRITEGGQGQGQGQAQEEVAKLGLARRGSSRISLRAGNTRPRTSMGMSLRVASRQGSMLMGGATAGAQVTGRAKSMRANTVDVVHARTRTGTGRFCTEEHLGPELRILSRAVLSVHGDMLLPQSGGNGRSNFRSARTPGGVGDCGGGGTNGQGAAFLASGASRKLQRPHSPLLLTTASGAVPQAALGALVTSNTLDAAEQELLQRLAGPASGSTPVLQARPPSRPNQVHQLGAQPSIVAVGIGDELLRSINQTASGSAAGITLAPCSQQARGFRPSTDMRNGVREGNLGQVLAASGVQAAAEGLAQPAATGPRVGLASRGKKPGVRRVATLALGQMKQWTQEAALVGAAAPRMPVTIAGPSSACSATADSLPMAAKTAAVAISAPGPSADRAVADSAGNGNGTGVGMDSAPASVKPVAGPGRADVAQAHGAATWTPNPLGNGLSCKASENARWSLAVGPGYRPHDPGQMIAARVGTVDVGNPKEAGVEALDVEMRCEENISEASNTTGKFASFTSLAAAATAAATAEAVAAAMVMAGHNTGSGDDNGSAVEAGTFRTARQVSGTLDCPAQVQTMELTEVVAKLPEELSACATSSPAQAVDLAMSKISPSVSCASNAVCGNAWQLPTSSSAPPPRLDLLMRAYRTVNDAVSRPPLLCSRLCSSGTGIMPHSMRESAQGTASTATADWRGNSDGDGDGDGNIGRPQLVTVVTSPPLQPLQAEVQTVDGIRSCGAAAPQQPDSQQGQDQNHAGGEGGNAAASARGGSGLESELTAGRSVQLSRASSVNSGTGSYTLGFGISGGGGISNNSTGLSPMLLPAGSSNTTPLHRLILMQQRVPSKSRMSAEIVCFNGLGGSSGAVAAEGAEASASSAAASHRRSLHMVLAPSRQGAGPIGGPTAAATSMGNSDMLLTGASCGNLVSAGGVTSGGTSMHGRSTTGADAIPSGGSGTGPATLHMNLRDGCVSRWESGPGVGAGSSSAAWERLPLATTRATAIATGMAASPSGSGCWTATAGGSGFSAAPGPRMGFAPISATPIRYACRGNSVRARVHALLDQAEQVELQRAASSGRAYKSGHSPTLNIAAMRPGSSIASSNVSLRPPDGLWTNGAGTAPDGSSVTAATLSLRPIVRDGTNEASIPCRHATSTSGRQSSSSLVPYGDLLKGNATTGVVIGGGSGAVTLDRLSSYGQHQHRHRQHNTTHQHPTAPVSAEAVSGFTDGASPFLNTMSRQESAMLQILTSIDDAATATSALATKVDGSGIAGPAGAGTTGGSGIFLHLGNSGGGVTGLMVSGGSAEDRTATGVAAISGGVSYGASYGTSGGIIPTSSFSSSQRQISMRAQGTSHQPLSMRWLSPNDLAATSDALELHEHGVMMVPHPSPMPITVPLGSAGLDKPFAYGNETGGTPGVLEGHDGSTGILEATLMANNATESSPFFPEAQRRTSLPCARGEGFAAAEGPQTSAQSDQCGAGGSGGGLDGRQRGQQTSRNDFADVDAAAIGSFHGMAPGGGTVAWCQLRARTCMTVDGRRVLMLIMSDVTKQIQNQERVASLVEQEHRILEALFPRHVIAYLTTPTNVDGEDDDVRRTGIRRSGSSCAIGAGAPALHGRTSRGANKHGSKVSPRWRRTAGGFNSSPRGDADVDGSIGGPSESASRGVMQLRQMARQHYQNTVKVSKLATAHKMVTILFSDIVGFTAFSRQVPPITVMRFLNELYQKLDALLDIYKVYKVETIGDCYVVAGGLVRYDEDGLCTVLPEGEIDELHAVRVMEFAKAMLKASREVALPTTGEPVQVRLGLHSGPAMSGVVGSKMPRFTVFGETVEAAHRMESSGRPGRIHVSGTTKALLRREAWEQTEGVQIDGRGRIDTYLWLGEEDDDAHKQRVMAVYL